MHSDHIRRRLQVDEASSVLRSRTEESRAAPGPQVASHPASQEMVRSTGDRLGVVASWQGRAGSVSGVECGCMAWNEGVPATMWRWRGGTYKA